MNRIDYNSVAPGGMAALAAVHAYVAASPLPKQIIDLVYLRMSQINGCAYCIDLHTRDLTRAGVDTQKLSLIAVWREVEAIFDERERAALAWAEAVTAVAAKHPTDHDYEAVVRCFSDKEVADLTIAVGIMNAYNRMAISFRVQPKVAVPRTSEN